MTGNEYQELSKRTIATPMDKKEEMLNHGVFGLTAEAGEVSSLLQKVYQGRPIDPVHMKKELGDVLWMVAEICTAMGFELDEIMQLNVDKLKARFPNGFTVENDLNRAKGDI